MFDFFGRKPLERKIAELESEVAIYRERNAYLEVQARKLKDTELIVRCQKMYIDDDAGIIELLDAAKKIEQWQAHLRSQSTIRRTQPVSPRPRVYDGQAQQAGACNQNSAFGAMNGFYRR